jgi:uncharacterized protein YodC (DUF2158 family)
MRRWYREAFAAEPMRSLHYYPVEWYMIDEHRGWVACQFWNRMADPGDGSIHESFEEDKLDPAEISNIQISPGGRI